MYLIGRDFKSRPIRDTIPGGSFLCGRFTVTFGGIRCLSVWKIPEVDDVYERFTGD